MPPLKINFGCGATAPEGWLNIDGSHRVLLERFPFIHLAGIQRHFPSNVRWMRISGSLPFADRSASHVYSSHMIEHLSCQGADRFIHECHRILEPGGRIRLMTPSLRLIVEDYMGHRADPNLRDRAADQMMRDMVVHAEEESGSVWKTILEGFRRKNWHQWLYDEYSLSTRLTAAGFTNVTVQENWTTEFPDLDSLEPASLRMGSICAEGRRA